MKYLKKSSFLIVMLLIVALLSACEDANYKQGKQLFAEGNYEEALEYLNQYASEKPNDFNEEAYSYVKDCYLNLGYELYAEGNYSDALTNFNTYKAALGEEDVSGYIYGCAYYLLLNDITTTGVKEYSDKNGNTSYTLSYEDMDENIMVAYKVMGHYPISFTNKNAHTNEYDLWIYLPEPSEVPEVPTAISWWYTQVLYDWGPDYLSRDVQTVDSASGELSPSEWFTLEKGTSSTKVTAHLDNDDEKESSAETFAPKFFDSMEKTIREKYLGIEFSDFGFKSLSNALAGL